MTSSSRSPLTDAEPRPPADEQSARRSAESVLHTADLFAGTREVLIEHGGIYYRLRLTHSNKLILTK
jgi:hemin uptake protein HemP